MLEEEDSDNTPAEGSILKFRLRQPAEFPIEVHFIHKIIELAEALGIDPEKFDIANIKIGQNGETFEVAVSVDSDVAEQVRKQIEYKIFDPNKDTTTIAGAEARVATEEEAKEARWAMAERKKKRSGPKGGKPTTPDH